MTFGATPMSVMHDTCINFMSTLHFVQKRKEKNPSINCFTKHWNEDGTLGVQCSRSAGI